MHPLRIISAADGAALRGAASSEYDRKRDQPFQAPGELHWNGHRAVGTCVVRKALPVTDARFPAVAMGPDIVYRRAGGFDHSSCDGHLSSIGRIITISAG